MNLIPFEKNLCYIENDQKSSIKFAPVYQRYTNYHTAWSPVKCRDKMNDLPSILATGCKVSLINGFTFNTPEVFDDYGDDLKIAVYLKPSNKKHFLKNFHIFNKFEENYGIKESKIEHLDNTEDALIIHSDMLWCKSPLTISVYTFLLRLITYCVKHKPEADMYDVIADIRDWWNAVYQGEDGDTCESLLNNPWYNLDVLMKNINYILSEAPLTGANDDVYDYGKYTQVRYKSCNINGKIISGDYDNHTAHCHSGFLSLFAHAQYMKKRMELLTINRLPLWVTKYTDALNNYKEEQV